MKKITFIILVSSISFNIYQYNQVATLKEELVFGDLEADMTKGNDKVYLAQSAVKKIVQTEKKEAANLNKVLPDCKAPMNDSDENLQSKDSELNHSAVEVAENLNKMNQRWTSDFNEYMEREMYLSTEKMASYYELKGKREVELAVFFEKQREKFLKENPDAKEDLPLFISNQEMIEIAKIEKKYNELLNQSFGQDDYKRYQNYLKRFNQEYAMRNSLPPISF